MPWYLFFFQGEVSEKQRRVCHGSDGRCHGGRQMHAESELCDPVWKQNHSWVILSFNISWFILVAALICVCLPIFIKWKLSNQNFIEFVFDGYVCLIACQTNIAKHMFKSIIFKMYLHVMDTRSLVSRVKLNTGTENWYIIILFQKICQKIHVLAKNLLNLISRHF